MMKSPQIRFNSYNTSDNWEYKPLDKFCELVTKQTGFDYSATIKPSLETKASKNNIPYLQTKFFSCKQFDLNTDFYIPLNVAQQFPKLILDKQAVLISIVGSIGNVGLYNAEQTSFLGGAICITVPKKVSEAEYIYQYLLSEYGNQQLRDFTKVGVQPTVTIEDIRKILIGVPLNPNELSDISLFFKNFDEIIDSKKSELNLLKQQKESMLVRLFPNSSNLVPEIRFEGFSGNWTKHSFGEFGKINSCKRIYKNQTSQKGEIPFYKIGTFGEKADAFISRDLFEKFKAAFQYPKKGDILLSASGTIGRCVEYKGEEEYFQDSNIIWLNHSDEISNTFLKYLYLTVTWSGLEGSTIKRLYNSNFLETEFFLPPTIDEQNKIGEFFENLDELIHKCEKEINLLSHLKETFNGAMLI